MNRCVLHQTKKMAIAAIFSLLLILLFSCSVYGAQVTLSWNRPADSRVTGYNIYCGITGTDFTTTPVQKISTATQTSALISGIEEGKTYSLAATSTDDWGNESAFSEAITHKVISPNDIDDDLDGYTENMGDCNDTIASIHPDAVEICGDDIDQDCNGSDKLCPENIDDDLDGYTENQGDLNDADATVYPGAEEICGDSVDQNGDGVDLECPPLMETDEVRVGNLWTYVPLSLSFTDPVVVATPMSSNGGEPAVIRIRNVSSEGFEIRVQEWGYLDGKHTLESVGYIVMEAGNYILPNGAMIKAGTFSTNGPKSILFPLGVAFSKVPVILTGIVTSNEYAAVVGRVYNVTTSGFNYALQEQERSNQVHITETIAYIAWEPSSGAINEKTYRVARTSKIVNQAFYKITFNSTFGILPVFVADMQTRSEVDTANIRWRNKTLYGVDVRVVEEISRDKETTHATEVVGYLVIE